MKLKRAILSLIFGASAASVPIMAAADTPSNDNRFAPVSSASFTTGNATVQRQQQRTGQAQYNIDPANFIASICQVDRQFLMFGDSSHTRVELIEYVRDSMPELARCGVRHLVIERAEYFMKDDYDAFMAGRISERRLRQRAEDFSTNWDSTREERIRRGNLYIDLFVMSRNTGIRLHFVNNHPDDFERVIGSRNMEFMSRISSRIASGEITRDDLSRRDRERYDRLGDRLVEWRLGQEEEFAKARTILRAVGNERTVVFYGLGHFDTDHGIDEGLGVDNTFTVYLTPDERYYNRYARRANSNGAEVILNIRNGQFTITGEGRAMGVRDAREASVVANNETRRDERPAARTIRNSLRHG